MDKLNDVIAKSVELNNAIKKLNEETKTINSIIEEKRDEKKVDILKELQKYADVMESLDISFIELKTSIPMYYKGSNKLIGISIRRHNHGVQINLGCMSNMMEGFYAYHSIGWVASGARNENLMNEFCNKWDYIKGNITNVFAEQVEKILNDRKDKAIAERENAIEVLTTISK